MGPRTGGWQHEAQEPRCFRVLRRGDSFFLAARPICGPFGPGGQLTAQRVVEAFSQWAHDGGVPRRVRRRFTPALRRCIANLPSRDTSGEIQFAEILGSDGMDMQVATPSVYVARYTTPSGDDRLGVATCAPFWSRGWRGMLKDEDLYDPISWFFHFAAQYIRRGRALAAVFSLDCAYDRAFDFRGPTMQFARFMPSCAVVPSKVAALERLGVPPCSRYSGRARLVERLLASTNGLDPFMHRALFQYLRARLLMEAGFVEEAVLALDCACAVAKEFVETRLGLRDGSARGGLDASLDVSRETQATLEHLYGLRCAFGGHPARSKWWDFAEIYADHLDTYFASIREVLWGLQKAEASYRVVDPNPSSWSNWFGEHGYVLYEAVWFARLPR